MKKIICLLIFLSAAQIFAREIKAIKTINAIKIDGLLSEEEWPKDIFQSSFIQLEPDRGLPAREITKVAVQYDEQNLYVAFICEKTYSDAVVAEQSRRDQLDKKDDVVAVILDTYRDSRSAYWFMVNCLDTQTDVRINDDGKTLDIEWDTGWQAKTALTESGYTVEFSIPFASIRHDPQLSTWGINFGRFIPKWLETSYWAGATDWDFRISNIGKLSGLELAHPSSEFHVIPYATGRYETFSDKIWENMTGLDLLYRYKNNMTANLTYAPDFATVEGDQEEINMTRWELFFPEKRNFFREGNDLFNNRLCAFYSRRIGEINFGGNVFSKSGKNTFAFIGVNAKKVENNPATSQDESFPESNIGIVRWRRDVLKSSTIGMMIVNKHWQNGYNRVLSLDGVFNLPHELYFTTQFVAGAPGAFNKNYGGFVRLARENNIYHYHLRYTELAEQFKESVNGVGFIKDDNRRELDSALEYKWWIKKSGFQFLQYQSNYNIYWSKSNGTLRSCEVIEEFKLYLENKFSLGIDYRKEYQLFEKGFYNYDVELELGYNTEEWSSTKFEYAFGKNFDRNYCMLQASKKIKIHDKFSLEYEMSRLTFKPDKEKESTWLNIATVNYQFTPDLFLRLFTQHRSATNRLYIYGIFGWRFKLPNSAIYFVYTRDDFDRIGLTREKKEIFFLKLAYDFRF